MLFRYFVTFMVARRKEYCCQNNASGSIKTVISHCLDKLDVFYPSLLSWLSCSVRLMKRYRIQGRCFIVRKGSYIGNTIIKYLQSGMKIVTSANKRLKLHLIYYS